VSIASIFLFWVIIVIQGTLLMIKSFVGLGIQCLEPVVGGKKSITFALKDLDYFDEFLLV
jgi:hypothetical protein